MEPTFSAANIIYLFYLETRLSFWRLFIFWIWSNLFESEEFFEAEGFNLAAGYFESRSFKKFWRLKKIAEDSKHQKVVIKKAWSRDKISKWYSLLKKEVPLKFKIIFFWYALLFDFNFVLNDIWSEWMLWKKAWFWLACICSSSHETREICNVSHFFPFSLNIHSASPCEIQKGGRVPSIEGLCVRALVTQRAA